MVSAFRQPLTAGDIKAKARALGADLVGIADGANLERNPPDRVTRSARPTSAELDGGRVIVLAKRVSRGVTRIAAWNDRHKYYNDELALTRLEEASLELVYWLEDNGYPAIIVPPTHVDPWNYDGDPARHLPTLLSLPHAAVEAGLGTLGLNLQLLTPEFGPRVSADRRALLGRCRVRQQNGDGALPRPRLRALPQGLSGRRRRSLGAQLAGLRPLSLAPRFRATERARDANYRRTGCRRGRRNWCVPRTASISGKAFCAAQA